MFSTSLGEDFIKRVLSMPRKWDLMHVRIQKGDRGRGFWPTLENHANIGLPAKRHWNGVSLASRWWPAWNIGMDSLLPSVKYDGKSQKKKKKRSKLWAPLTKLSGSAHVDQIFHVTHRALLFWAWPSICTPVCLYFLWTLTYSCHLSPAFFQVSSLDYFLSKSCPSSNMGFVHWTITKMATKMAATSRFALVDTLSH